MVPGAAWQRTSVFLMLIVRPKAFAAVEKVSQALQVLFGVRNQGTIVCNQEVENRKDKFGYSIIV